MIYIYALLDAAGKCLYVGQTVNPEQRMQSHKRKKPFRMLIVRKAFPRRSCQIEGQVIRAYKRRGEAKFNKQVAPGFPSRHPLATKNSIKWIYSELKSAIAAGKKGAILKVANKAQRSDVLKLALLNDWDLKTEKMETGFRVIAV